VCCLWSPAFLCVSPSACISVSTQLQLQQQEFWSELDETDLAIIEERNRDIAALNADMEEVFYILSLLQTSALSLICLPFQLAEVFQDVAMMVEGELFLLFVCVLCCVACVLLCVRVCMLSLRD
jgi:hypothetical protein